MTARRRSGRTGPFRLDAACLDADRIRAMTATIGRELLKHSPYVRTRNFRKVHPDDLAFLFDAYDRQFLSGFVWRRLARDQLAFRLSSRMTSAGGKTLRRAGPNGNVDYEIAISSFMLFDGFGKDDPVVKVCGLPCADRLEALQRIMEHEIVHLVEFIGTGRSNCRGQPFQALARGLFLHRTSTHQLFTRRQRAAQDGILVGSPVAFQYRAKTLTGRVNRITKRATVLVADPSGDRYSDGGRYLKYYVPLSELVVLSS